KAAEISRLGHPLATLLYECPPMISLHPDRLALVGIPSVQAVTGCAQRSGVIQRIGPSLRPRDEVMNLHEWLMTETTPVRRLVFRQITNALTECHRATRRVEPEP